ncbi:arginase family protein [Nonomuraea wenchangensis]
MTTALCVPQWQGSASDRAPRLMAGARRAAGLVPADAVVTVPVVEAGGDKAAGVRAFDVLVENQRLTREALAGIDDRVITVGGDCAVDIAPIAAARARYGDALTVLWIDAHPDVYSPRTLPSGAFHGMVVRALLGDGPAGLALERPQRLAGLVSQVDDIVGAAITEYAPSGDDLDPGEAATIRLLAAALAGQVRG